MAFAAHKRKKIAVIGAGFVGSTTAHWAAQKELGDVFLVDINEGTAIGKSMDLMQSSPIEKFDSRVKGTSNYADIAGADVVILTAGMPRKPGMSRDELVGINAKIVKDCCAGIKQHAPDSIVIVVCNPMDVMAVYAKQQLGFPRERVIGMGGSLDSARFRAFIAEELNVSIKDVTGVVLGNHGDAMMPVVRTAAVSSVPIMDLMPIDRINAIVARTKQAGAEIGGHLKTGSAYYAPSRGAIEMAEAILKDQKRIIPCAVELNGEFGVNDKLMVGVLCQLGGAGMEKIIDFKMNADEKAEFDKSVEAVRTLVSALKTVQ
ncbi:MAG: malate dehydrogenase [Bdellovibrionales bacterium RIFCSPHIGHO2_01_FULL_40_29]|nr:MAG: malate dehydrogenase [Bdellovibrionales bacterium RIFCSPHIGHO2_01_FULL_40_29]OFZ34748.1 MAG: malate dehydrogenase [Bdellovibrionales bacterium RIFCSPHIGHO2_02_FULL_40_15]